MKGLYDIIEDFKDKKVLVIGDLMLDKFIFGDVNRISAEAPVQVVKVEKIDHSPGGAGNTANNITSLGGKAYITGVIGNDEEGEVLLSEFKKRNIDVEGIIKDNSRPTTQKTRVMGMSQHLIRFDHEKDHYIEKTLEYKIIDYLQDNIKLIDCVIVSDYIKGTITEKIAKSLIYLVNNNEKNILVDTKPKHSKYYKDITLLKPNLKEAIEMTGEQELIKIGYKLKDQFNANILITRGKEGMSLFFKEGKYLDIAADTRDVFDVGGAGDTVIATAGLALCAKASLEDAAYLANIAASIVVSKIGIVPITLEEIKYKLENK